MLSPVWFSKTTQNLFEKKVQNILKSVHILTLSQSFDASNSFSIEWVVIFVFLYIELIFAHFRHFRENVRCQCCIYTCCDSVENKITFFKKISWNFCRKIIYDSFYGLCGNESSLFNLNFFFYCVCFKTITVCYCLSPSCSSSSCLPHFFPEFRGIWSKKILYRPSNS